MLPSGPQPGREFLLCVRQVVYVGVEIPPRAAMSETASLGKRQTADHERSETPTTAHAEPVSDNAVDPRGSKIPCAPVGKQARIP